MKGKSVTSGGYLKNPADAFTKAPECPVLVKIWIPVFAMLMLSSGW